eukprot:TRINITY_DN5738_c0_g1_i1.p1 TRINITY_DN5738_c0_g1~~TRINITY_DN5738_c0_g1_i1.p1  ORF type:complete len:628 (+),score=133.83 TRINITY_DN5738_c0_g1_i1:393-2276(+)
MSIEEDNEVRLLALLGDFLQLRDSSNPLVRAYYDQALGRDGHEGKLHPFLSAIAFDHSLHGSSIKPEQAISIIKNSIAHWKEIEKHEELGVEIVHLLLSIDVDSSTESLQWKEELVALFSLLLEEYPQLIPLVRSLCLDLLFEIHPPPRIGRATSKLYGHPLFGLISRDGLCIDRFSIEDDLIELRRHLLELGTWDEDQFGIASNIVHQIYFTAALASSTDQDQIVVGIREQVNRKILEGKTNSIKDATTFLQNILKLGMYHPMHFWFSASDLRILDKMAIPSDLQNFWEDICDVQISDHLNIASEEIDVCLPCPSTPFERYPLWRTCQPIIGTYLPTMFATLHSYFRNLQRMQFNIDDMENEKILIAGCGTGHRCVLLAKQHPNAQVYGCDSKSVVQFAQYHSHHLRNVKFFEGDAATLKPSQAMGGDFDFVEAYSIRYGNILSQLTNLVKLMSDGAFIRIELDSPARRSRIRHVQKWIATNVQFDPPLFNSENVPIRIATDEEVLRCRSTMVGAPRSVQLVVLSIKEDAFSIQGFGKNFLNPSDRSIEEIHLPSSQSILQKLNLHFLGFFFENIDQDGDVRNQYAQMFPEDEAMDDLSHWAQLESQDPFIFEEGYVFYCQKRIKS